MKRERNPAAAAARGVCRVQALSYRCLRYVDQKLPPFQILVGPNASGKSTLLDMVAFVSDLLRSDLDAAVRGDPRNGIPHRGPDPRHLTWMRRGGSFEVALELALPDPLLKEKNGAYHRIRYEVAVQTEDVPAIEVENLYLLGDGTEESGQAEVFPELPRPPDHIVRQPRTRTPSGWKKIIARGEGSTAYFTSETTGWNAPFALSGEKLALASLPEDRERFPRALWLRDTLKKGVCRLQLSSEAMRLPAPPTRKEGFLPDGSNLPHVVDRLRADNPGRHRRWVEHVREALGDIADIETAERAEDRHRYLVLRYASGFEAPAWLTSDGTLRLLALTLLAYSTDVKGGTYLVEEPENGIHPRAMETVYQALSSVYDAQILLATHSPVILGLARPEDLLCFARGTEGATAIVRGDRHPHLKEWKGTLDLSTLFASGVLG